MHLLHGELFEDRIIFVQTEPAEPVQDAILLCRVRLGLARNLCVGLQTRLGVRQGRRLGMGQVEGLRLCTWCTAGLWL